jgi:quinol monooxygenase YgiN
MIVLMIRITVKLGTEEECIRLCREITQETLKEPGCLQYVVQQSLDNAHCFAFYEQYVDQAALDAHWASPHFIRIILGGLDKLVESRTRELFEPIG